MLKTGEVWIHKKRCFQLIKKNTFAVGPATYDERPVCWNCVVKANAVSDWKAIPVGDSQNAHRFLKRLIRLENTPLMKASTPPRNEMFTIRLELVEGRTKTIQKMNALNTVLDAVF